MCLDSNTKNGRNMSIQPFMILITKENGKTPVIAVATDLYNR